MKHKIVKIVHKNYQGITFVSYFIKGVRGFIPLNIEKGVLAEVQNKIDEIDVGEIEIEL